MKLIKKSIFFLISLKKKKKKIFRRETRMISLHFCQQTAGCTKEHKDNYLPILLKIG